MKKIVKNTKKKIVKNTKKVTYVKGVGNNILLSESERSTGQKIGKIK